MLGIGADILASAGSDAKRDHLRALGIVHVMNSRSLEFAEDVRAATQGRGVDVVLNALSGAIIPVKQEIDRDLFLLTFPLQSSKSFHLFFQDFFFLLFFLFHYISIVFTTILSSFLYK